jgi:hypothetical protein
MKVNFQISKWANFYYFLHNFAKCEWPWPYRPTGPISIWQKKFGEFNQEERKALRDFKRIYRRYFLKYYLGKLFFEEKNPWLKLPKKISKMDTQTLKEIYSIFEKKFDIIYQENIKFLKQWRKQLRRALKQPRHKNLERLLSLLFGLDLSHCSFNIYLLLGRDLPANFRKYAGGAGGERGRGLARQNILLEFDIKCPQRKINYITGVLWHEITHYCVETSKIYNLLKGGIKNQRGVNYIEEIIIRSLFPIGILSVKFLGAPPPSTLTPFIKSPIPEVNAISTKEIMDLIYRYIRQRKKLDNNYLQELIKILSETKKWTTLLK